MMETYYVGWDVGAWHSSKKDGIVILKKNPNPNSDSDLLCLIEPPFLGNISTLFAKSNLSSSNLSSWIHDQIGEKNNFIMAIDAILGCPQQAMQIWDISKQNKCCCPDIEAGARNNNYLYRYVETKFKEAPLSLVQDRMGSQSTKALFALKQCNALWNFEADNFGVWIGGNDKYLETYPTNARGFLKEQIGEVCKQIEDEKLRSNMDIIDAVTCAIIAFQFSQSNLKGPSEDCFKDGVERIQKEGWIWLPKEYWSNNS